MSSSLFDLGLRLRAHHMGKPVPRTATKRFDLQRDAMLVAVLAAPGDHAGVWGVAWSTPQGKTATATVGDPRARAGSAMLWNDIGKAWEPWITGLAAHDRAPQFALADTAAVQRLGLSARDALRDEGLSASGACAARTFLVAEHLARTQGQQAIAAMTELLGEHYVSGRDPLDERHLGLWAQLPTLRPGWDAPQVALPPGADAPDAPLGKAWDRLREHLKKNQWVWDETADALATGVASPVRRIVQPRLEMLRAAVRLYQRHPAGPIPGTDGRRAEELETFTFFAAKLATPSGRSLRSQWHTLARREEAAERWQEALWTFDELERARGIASGDVLVGQANHGTVLTGQSVVRVRPGDRLITDQGTRFQVTDLAARAEGIAVETDCPDLEGGIVAWPAAVAIRQPVPSEVPWTHDPQAAAPLTGSVPEGDLLERVQALRS